ncbi:nitrate reductase [Stenotrophobium rhamnosiphilum]|uniref:nitrate reductase (cytochrome) n=1 Tax=Stenotrophobium rhamnosiphilum TaxID=2029166 RepID=A0A2T5MKS3_9GAMM|nr:nitrate reductase [Stenotrophobium rhamnosiphilum]PTU33172.1 nitrate reductase [Stenotrophobium rhamnosiphilum]
MNAVKTTCPYCGVGCGVLAAPRKDGGADISGDPQHPSNFGKLCVKGSALGETLGDHGRLLYPQMHGERVGWDAALDHVAQGFRKIIDEHGPDAVALYVSGQLLTEDYYVANKLMKGYVGTANIDTNSRLCMSSAVAGHKRAFGEDLVPISYEDLELADLVVLVGSNTAWCHPILFQRIVKAKEQRPEMKIVVLDPRRTATCELADLHLPLRAGTDVTLFNGLLTYLHQHGVVDTKFVDGHTTDVERTLAIADNTAGDLRSVARACRIEPSVLGEFYRMFARTEKAITAFSMGVNQSGAGTDKVNSIINCHLLTGRIGKPGMGPFSITGQPNAMGGREVGGLANMLAAHMELANPTHREIVQEFWKSPAIVAKQGLKAVDLFNAIDEGKVKAVWIMATNPVVSLPDADKVKSALSKCELVVVSDIIEKTDTAAYAHVLLPAAGWGEKDGTVTNSDRRISRQRAFLPLPGEAKPDWWIIGEVAKRMGYAEGFNFSGAHEVFDEHARLSAYRNEGSRCFDINGLSGLDRQGFDAMDPIQWPVLADAKGTPRLFENGRYFHADGKARFIPTPPRGPAHATDAEFPLVLNTGRIRDQWHTMTRTGRSPKLASHIPEPFVDMHPHDALMSGVRDGELVRVATRWGALVARLKTTPEQGRGAVFVPIHWNNQFASDARVGALVNPAVDPVSGEPEFKHTPVRVEAFGVAWHGFILSRDALDVDGVTWWTRIQGQQFIRYELGGRGVVQNWNELGRTLLNAESPDADWLEYSDKTAGIYRGVLMDGERIKACIYVSPRPDLPSRAWLSGLFGKKKLEDIDRVGLLIGEPVNKQADTGPTVCSCFGVGRNTITDAIRKRGLKTAGEVTACLKAGGNCGSCVPEIKSLIAQCAAIAEETAA